MTPLLRRGAPRKDPSDHVITLIGKPDCHLCADARSVITRLSAELGFEWRELDIGQDEELYRTVFRSLGPLHVFGTAKEAMAVMERMWAMREWVDEGWDIAKCLNVLGTGVLLA